MSASAAPEATARDTASCNARSVASRASPGAELVGDLYEKLAALGARDVGALLTQSPTVKRQLARMRAASEERDDA